MRRKQTMTGLLAGASSLVLASLCLSLPATASTPLASVVAQTPESWTPNVSAGPPPSGQNPGCNTTFFGAGSVPPTSLAAAPSNLHSHVSGSSASSAKGTVNR